MCDMETDYVDMCDMETDFSDKLGEVHYKHYTHMLMVNV